MKKTDAVVFILLGQSNAVGHGLPMKEEDRILLPLKNVFGLKRDKNQSFCIDELMWDGYTSYSMNLGEEQDNTYSIANLLALSWQSRIDEGALLPDLYIVHIAIGAQGVSEKYMWYPYREKRLIPGVLGKADISLYTLTVHIMSLLDKSFESMGKSYEISGLHWRGGEEDVSESDELLNCELQGIYEYLFDGFKNSVRKTVPIVLHRIECRNLFSNEPEKSAEINRHIDIINSIFESLSEKDENISVYDVRKLPMYNGEITGSGIFESDCVHFTREANECIAKEILYNFENDLFFS